MRKFGGRWGRLRRFLVSLLSFLFALALAEVAIRVADPFDLSYQTSWHFLLHDTYRLSSNDELVWEHVPGFKAQFPAYEVSINSRGLRGGELGDVDENFRVLCLGDSFTFGSGVDHDEVWCEILAREISRDSAKPAVAINAGFNGYNTLQELEWLRSEGVKYAPDVVLLFWIQNDLESLTGRGSELPQADQMRQFLTQHDNSGIRRKLVHGAYSLMPGLTGLARYAAKGHPGRTDGPGEESIAEEEISPWETPSGAANARALHEMIDFCEAGEMRLCVFSYEYRSDLERAIEGEAIYFSIIPPGQEDLIEGLQITRWDPHPNAKGHRVIAERLKSKLLELNSLP